MGRFMLIVKASKDSEAGVMPSAELLSEMGKFNEEMARAGILVDGAGLHPSSKGARVVFEGDKNSVVPGPFGNTEELVAGYWIINVSSLQEAIDWARKSPNPMREVGQIEVRQFFELEDFPNVPDEVREFEKRFTAEKT